MRDALDMLKCVQFARDGGSDMTDWGICPLCRAADWKGHRDDCALDKLMQRLEEATKP